MDMMANYEGLATELLQVNEDLLRVPARHLISKLTQGEHFVLNYLLTHRHQAHPVDLSRGLEAIQTFRSQVIRSAAQMLADLGPEDAREFIRIQKKLLANQRPTG